MPFHIAEAAARRVIGSIHYSGISGYTTFSVVIVYSSAWIFAVRAASSAISCSLVGVVIIYSNG